MTDDYEALAFGAKIQRRRGAAPVDSVMVTEPVEGGVPRSRMAPRSWAARGTSQPRSSSTISETAIALVASQDRRFTVFAWSPCEGSVHAHRVETLLL